MSGVMKLKKSAVVLLLLLVLPLMLSGVTIEAQAQTEPVHHIAVSVPSLAGIITDIGGDLVAVSSLLDQETDPHAVTMTPEILATADAADLLILTGHFHWEEELANQTSTPFITLHSEASLANYEDYGASYSPLPGIVQLPSEDAEHDHEGNPHAYWLLPRNAIAIANATRVALSILNATLTNSWNANFNDFVSRMDKLQSLIDSLDDVHEFSSMRAIVVAPAEAYVAETFGIQCDAVLQVEDITLSGAKLLEVQNALRNGSVSLILGSDVAQFQAGGEFAYQLQADYGGTLIWWKTVFYDDMDYFSMMSYNLGALVSGIEGRSGDVTQNTTNLILLALSVVLVTISAIEGVLLIQRARAD